MLMTFIVCSYQQENMILQTLESIKNQVIKYSEDAGVQLIIADDGSRDNTYKIEKWWVEKYKDLFKDCVLLPSDKNRGINGNVIRTFDYIKGKYFHTIGGDDIISDHDLLSFLENEDVYVCSYLVFTNNRISYNSKIYENQYLLYGLNIKIVKFFSNFIYPFTTQSLILKSELISKNVINEMIRYKFLEDRPEWYAIMKQSNINIGYKNVVNTLYRHSEKGITFKDNPIHGLHFEDLRTFYIRLIQNTENYFFKWILFCQLKYIESGMKLWLYINPLNYFTKALRIIRRHRIKAYINYIYNNSKSTNSYLSEVLNKANLLYQEFSEQSNDNG